VFTYTIDWDVCKHGDDGGWSYRRYFPKYLVHSLNQAAFSQVHSDVYLLSNYKECSLVDKEIMSKVSDKVIKVDVADLPSAEQRTERFYNASLNVFMGDSGSLWIASAMRFFYMRDLMTQRGWHEFVHVEGDNMLYIDTTTILPHLRSSYGPGLAVTPLQGDNAVFTASVMWVGSPEALSVFTDYLLELAGKNTTLWTDYLTWLKPYACCKQGSGILEDQFGRGLKPHKIEEMTMMAYYRTRQNERMAALAQAGGDTSLGQETSNKIETVAVTDNNNNNSHKEDGKSSVTTDNVPITQAHLLKLFPVLPPYDYHVNKFVCNMSMFARGGKEVPAFVYDDGASKETNTDVKYLLYDPGSYGQNLGGTNNKGGRNKGYKDATHIVGQAMRLNSCKVTMLCGTSRDLHVHSSPSSGAGAGAGAGASGERNETCYAAPYMKCGHNAAEAKEAEEAHLRESSATLQREIEEKYLQLQRNSNIEGTSDLRTKVRAETEQRLHEILKDYRDQQYRTSTGWKPIYNLHIHAKRTQHYLSQNWKCDCSTPLGEPIGWAPGAG
jgi:hypothetical protein